jgi:folylpolyglutamate synthase/dihydropteroate synthase
LSLARWPGRFDVGKFGGNTIIVDGAHNEDAMRRFTSDYLKSPFASKKSVFVFGALRGKNHRAMARSIARAADSVAVRALDGPRALGTGELSGAFNKILKTPVSVISGAGGLKQFLRRKTRANIVVAGSLRLAGEALSIIFGNRRT